MVSEALAISLAGGLLGIALGLVGARQIALHFGWPFFVHLDVIVISVAFSAMVGVVFGLYPAQKAARLNPIDALRFE